MGGSRQGQRYQGSLENRLKQLHIFNLQKILIKDCRRLPVHHIDTRSKREIHLHDQIVECVKEMIQLQFRLRSARTDQERTVIERQIAAKDRQIDKLVYELYDLTDEEIAAVESALTES